MTDIADTAAEFQVVETAWSRFVLKLVMEKWSFWVASPKISLVDNHLVLDQNHLKLGIPKFMVSHFLPFFCFLWSFKIDSVFGLSVACQNLEMAGISWIPAGIPKPQARNAGASANSNLRHPGAPRRLFQQSWLDWDHNSDANWNL